MLWELMTERLWAIVAAGGAVFASVSPEQMEVLEAAFVILIGVGADWVVGKRRESRETQRLLHARVKAEEIRAEISKEDYDAF